ncbi:MAG: arsenate reductase ArsC [Candidatus Lokiarchaeota archaeon]|nr:arsenate reductase ArsC [Candidatus Lokiarchaeota archaeon]
MKRVLFLCTGNSARSQMSEALLRKLGEGKYEVFSAGTNPASEVNPFAIEVLKEKEIDTTGLRPKLLSEFEGQTFDIVITVCDHAKQECPTFPGAKKIDHWSLEDPAAFQGSHMEILTVFRETRDEIERRIKEFLLQGKTMNDPMSSLKL